MSDLIERLDHGLDERAAKCTDQRDGFYMRAAAARIRELETERDARVSIELLNIERETCDRIRSDNDRLRARIRELEKNAG